VWTAIPAPQIPARRRCDTLYIDDEKDIRTRADIAGMRLPDMPPVYGEAISGTCTRRETLYFPAGDTPHLAS